MKKILRSERGEFVIDSTVKLFIGLLVIAIFAHLAPVIVAAQQLNTYSTELVRTAAISGRVGEETEQREEVLNRTIGLKPEVTWSSTGKIQLNDEITVTCSVTKKLGGWGGYADFPIHLSKKATSRSEVYWK
ncbi:DUF4320 family protein [Faecalispora anaeroviscerum]|uniref:DUF4320 family protein n=1 Tax=Faecalispora anaeroviscerum TaxID=2991836 RepID=UPI0024BB0AA0|nr:DUF4320 family protein [Faecalispora anaeroviscerum]